MPSEGGRDPVAGPDSGPEYPFPLKLNGPVIKGFGRGSKELGIPTANIPLEGLHVGGREEVDSGIYYGLAGLSSSNATATHPPNSEDKYNLMNPQIYDGMKHALLGKVQEGQKSTTDKGVVYPMVMSVGYNPFYNNTVRSVEVHIMHDFAIDFYDTHMNLIILGFIRPELDYVSKEKLIEDIKTDIDVSGRSISRETYARFVSDPYLLDFSDKSELAT